jgi:hypothetical protein
MQLKTDKWGDVKWIGGEGRNASGYSLVCEGSRGRMIVTSKCLAGAWVEMNPETKQWDVLVGHEVAESCRTKRDAQDALLEYVR